MLITLPTFQLQMHQTNGTITQWIEVKSKGNPHILLTLRLERSSLVCVWIKRKNKLGFTNKDYGIKEVVGRLRERKCLWKIICFQIQKNKVTLLGIFKRLQIIITSVCEKQKVTGKWAKVEKIIDSKTVRKGNERIKIHMKSVKNRKDVENSPADMKGIFEMLSQSAGENDKEI